MTDIPEEALQTAPMSEEEIRADERHRIAEGFRAAAARCRAIPDEGLTIGEIHRNREQAVANDRIADMVEKRNAP